MRSLTPVFSLNPKTWSGNLLWMLILLEYPGLTDIFPRLWWSLFESYYMDPPLYWSWLCYHLIMDLRLCLVAMIVFNQSLLPWICIVLVSSHVMSYMRFESVILQQLPTNILALDFFTLKRIHLSHSYNFMPWGAFCYTEISSCWPMC